MAKMALTHVRPFTGAPDPTDPFVAHIGAGLLFPPRTDIRREAMAKLESGRAKGKIVVTMPDNQAGRGA